jgi:hypothetical protein
VVEIKPLVPSSEDRNRPFPLFKISPANGRNAPKSALPDYDLVRQESAWADVVTAPSSSDYGPLQSNCLYDNLPFSYCLPAFEAVGAEFKWELTGVSP